MTEKLYYADAYIKEFDAKVLSCEPSSDGFAATLDRTAFFPEAGGQYSDTGYINGIEVYDVKEIGETIYHYVKKPLNVNDCVHCVLNFDERFDKMQQHTAEHIISGILHSMYGAENTGFHLGAKDVTLDTSIPVTREMLAEVERLVNIAIQKNVPVTSYFPSESELKNIEYRSKLDLTENVRIVDIEGYDSCACCAPHVSSSAQIGILKFVDVVKFHSGSRIRMLAGMRAYDYIATVMSEAAAVSAMLSAPQSEISKETEKLLSQKATADRKLSQLAKQTAQLLAEGFDPDSSAVAYLPALDMDALRAYVNAVSPKVKGALVALTGDEGAYRYIIYYDSPDIARLAKEANLALSGKGGGRAPMATGSFSASLDDIKKFFEK